MRVFLDANILWSAAHRRGAVRILLEQLQAAGHRLVVDGFVVEEATRNLPAAAQDRLRVLLESLEVAPSHADSPRLPDHGLPEKDIPVLRAAIVLRCDCLVTGDRRHFGHLMGRRIEGVRVLATADAADLLPPAVSRR